VTDYGLPERANITAISDALAMGRGHAKKILDAAKIRHDKDGKYDSARAIEALTAFSDADKALGLALAGANREKQKDHLAQLASAKAQAEMARARKLEIEVAQKEGRLVSREAVQNELTSFATFIRNGFLGLPAKIAHRFVGVRSAEDAERILDELIREELAALSDIDLFALDD
jgi:phage terminase Nu1 subunit (DNA packaging protein)